MEEAGLQTTSYQTPKLKLQVAACAHGQQFYRCRHWLKKNIPARKAAALFADYVNFVSASNLPAHVYGECSPMHHQKKEY